MRALASILDLVGGRSVPASPGPDFRDEVFFDALSAEEAEQLREAAVAFRSGERERARAAVVRHFRRRSAPRFFFDPWKLGQLVAEIERRWPTWKRATLNRVDAERSAGLEIYAATGPRLDATFEWRRLKAGPGDDLLYEVRPHRFGFLPRWALATVYGGCKAGDLRTVVQHWTASGSDGGHAYVSNLVVASRAIASTWAWAFLAGSGGEDADLEFTILKLIRTDAVFLADRLGDSVANNHLLADGFALWYLGLLFPEFVGARGWRVDGEAVWLRELRRQTYEDGTSFEHGTHYHELATEMAAAYLLLSRRNGVEPDGWVVDRVRRMLHFQVELGGPESSPLALGDTTEDPVFPLDSGEGWGTAALRELYRALFDPALSPTSAEQPAVERAFWLLGGALAPRVVTVSPNPRWSAFPVGGYDVFAEGDGRTRLLFRSGPAPGVELWAGHMHGDLLSVCLTLENTPVIVEPGTYTYRSKRAPWPAGAPAWRAHFLGARAHSGLAILDEDPLGPADGDFRSGDARSRVERTRALGGRSLTWVEAAIAGNTAYRGHRRGVIHIQGGGWLLYDLPPDGVAADRLSVGFQLAPGACVSLRDGPSAHVETDGVGLWILAGPGFAEGRIAAGQREPLAGWVSPRYGVLSPAPRLDFTVRETASTLAIWLRPAGTAADAVTLETRSTQEGGLGVRLASGDWEEYVLLRLGPPGAVIEVWGIEFVGSLLWLRTRGGIPVALRWLDGQRVTWRSCGLDVKTPQCSSALDVARGEAGAEVAADAGNPAITW